MKWLKCKRKSDFNKKNMCKVRCEFIGIKCVLDKFRKLEDKICMSLKAQMDD